MFVTSLNRSAHLALSPLHTHTLGHSSCEFTCTAVTITSTICTIIVWKLPYFHLSTRTGLRLSHIPTGQQTVRYSVHVCDKTT